VKNGKLYGKEKIVGYMDACKVFIKHETRDNMKDQDADMRKIFKRTVEI
jgi:hypothetical protein